MMSLESAVLDVLSQSVMPTKLAAITRGVKALVGKGFKKELLVETLDSLVREGRVQAIALTPSRLLDLSYSAASPLEIAAQILRIKVHAAAKPLKQADLRKKLPAALQPFFETAFQALVERREIFVLAKGGIQVMKRPPRPSDFMDAAKVRSVGALLQQANSLRETALTLDDFLAWLDGDSASVPTVSSVLPPTEEWLRHWYAQDRARSSTQMIPIPQTWRRYSEWTLAEGGVPGLEVFKTLLQNLYNVGKVLLEPCERPQDLPPEERSLLVPLAIGPPGFAWSWVS